MAVGLQIVVSGDQNVLKILGAVSSGMKTALGKVILREAQDLRALMVTGIRDQAPGGRPFKPLSELTKKLRMTRRKGSSRVLSRSVGTLRSEMAKRTKAVLSGSGRASTLSGSVLGVRSSKRAEMMEKRLARSDRAMEKAEARLGKATEGMKALINSGSLLGSIKVTRLGGSPLNGVFVGVHRNARKKAGAKGDPVSIAAVHENGSKAYTINVTPKMRRWWFAMYKAGVFNAPLSRRTTSIRNKIPARPFVRPSVEVWRRDLEKRLAANIDLELKAAISKAGGKVS